MDDLAPPSTLRPARLVEHPGDDPLAHLLFTSGTTGEAKGVPHRLGTLNRAVRAMSRRIGLTPADRLHIASPMAHHSGFLYGMWLSLLEGQLHVLQPAWDPGRALSAFDAWGGTFMQGSAPFLKDLLDAVDAGEGAPRSLRTFVITGSSVPRHLAARARDVLGLRVCAAWGSTETCMATLSAPDDDPEHVTATDGRPLDGVRLRVVDDEGRQLGRRAEGHLEVTGPFVFDGYLDRPDLTAEAFTDDGWYRTGDLAVIETSGHVRITGRAKDVVNRGGEKVPVKAIEDLLLAHPSIADAAIVAMPDERLGERACLFAVPTGDASPALADVRRHLDEQGVTKLHWPEHLELVDELPRNQVGKVRKNVLREIAAGIAGDRARRSGL